MRSTACDSKPAFACDRSPGSQSDGHQTPIVTSLRDLSAVEVADRVISRWRQENFFKCLREEYALDVLVDYDVEPADAAPEVPNLARARIDAELYKARAVFKELLAQYGGEALTNSKARLRTVRAFHIANAAGRRQTLAVVKRMQDLDRRRAYVPKRAPIRVARPKEVHRLAVERKHLTNLLKMVAYQAKGDLVARMAPRYRRAEDEGRTRVQSILAQSGVLRVVGEDLRVAIEPRSSPPRSCALLALCEELNATRTFFPGSSLRPRFEVKPEPKHCPAFPGPPPPEHRQKGSKPNISDRG